MIFEPGFPVFRETVSAICWPALCWLERRFAFFSPVWADGLCHIFGIEVVRATITLFFHCITHAVLICILKISGKIITASVYWWMDFAPFFANQGMISHPLYFSWEKSAWWITPLAIRSFTRGSAFVRPAWRVSTVLQTILRSATPHGFVMFE